MAIRLGIDTGGNFTDAVAVAPDDTVLAEAKAATTHEDLALGIGEALRAVLDRVDARPVLVGLSTTLATNAIVEGRGGRAALVLIGLEPALLERARLREAVGDAPVIAVAGGHDAFGREVAALDEEALEQRFAAIHGRVEAAAVVGRFAVREAAHERRAAELLRRRFGLPVTCSHELTSRIDAPRRALTTFLNARLLPEIDRLLRAVGDILAALGITAPLMVVRGDGSLVRAATARLRPVETILSGPAASVVGAVRLARMQDAAVVDVGGTTTDIAFVERGRPRLAPRGARVGGYETMVEAVDLETTGLGGDSEVTAEADGRLRVGPARLVPLAHLAPGSAAVLDELRAAFARPPRDTDGRFVVRAGRIPEAELDRSERRLLALLAEGPVPLAVVRDREVLGAALGRLERRGLVRRAGFTPTDAAHVLGRQATGSVEAARLGAALEARRLPGARAGEVQPVELFARRALEAAEQAATTALVRAALSRGDGPAGWLAEAARSAVGERALSPAAPPAGRPLVEMRLRYMRPVVGVGGPARLLLPRPAAHLDTPLVVPPHHAVCNAFGAVVGEVVHRVEIRIGRDEEERFLVHLPGGTRTAPDREAALRIAEEEGRRLADMRAREDGLREAVITVEIEERAVETAEGGRLLLEASVVATARGRPAAAAG